MFNDDEVAVEDSTAEPLNIEEDQAFLSEMLSKLALLNRYTITFNDERAVCQAQIRELVEHCDVALDQRYPIESFTKDLSSQNLVPATEAIFARQGKVVMELLKKAAEIIRKIIRWVLDLFKSIVGKGANQRKRIAVIRVLINENKAIAPLAKRPELEMPDFNKALLKARDTAMEAAATAYNGLIASMVYEQPYVGVLKRVGLMLPGTIKLLEVKANLVEKALIEMQKGDINAPALLLRDALVPCALGKTMETLVGQHPELRGSITLQDFFRLLKDWGVKLYHNKPTAPLEWEIAAQLIVDRDSVFAEPPVPEVRGLERSFQDLSKKVDPLIKESSYEIGSKVEGGLFDQATVSLVHDVYALQYYFSTVEEVYNRQIDFVNAIYNCAVAEFEIYREKARSSKDAALVQEINNAMQRLRGVIA